MQAADALRTMRGSSRKPPGTSACEPLIDVLVHGQDITVPLGGFKQSGFGRDKSLHALDAYTDLKTAWIAL